MARLESTMNSASFRIDELVVVRSGRRILDNARLAPTTGKTTVLTGPSGGGKTTLLRVVLGLALAESGRVTIGDRVATDGPRVLIPPEARGFGVVFQDLALWPHLSVARNLAFVLAAARVPRGERAERISTILAQVGLAGTERRFPGELSGGEQQRAALARALIGAPRVLLLDEPLVNLDIVTRRELRLLLRRLLKESATTTVYVTHDPDDIEELAEDVAVLERGKIVQHAPLDEILRAPATAFTAELVKRLA
jgi:iron(III) transport system ATP-binding protein